MKHLEPGFVRSVCALACIWSVIPFGCSKKTPPGDSATAAADKPVVSQPAGNPANDNRMPMRTRDGKRVAVVDMRVRTSQVASQVQPKDDGWEPGGDWRVFEIPYRDGGLKFELAFRVPADSGARQPVAGSIRLVAGDAKPFLKALAYIFGTQPTAGLEDGKQGDRHDMDVLIQTTTGKDTGLAELEPTGGDWLVVRCLPQGGGTDLFEMKINPKTSLGRISPPATARKQALDFLARALLP